MKRFALLLIRLYQTAISPFRPACCRYEPTCSQYALEAVEVHGVCKGFCLAVRRILRCHPLSHHGRFDPVPPAPCRHHPLKGDQLT